VEIQNRESLRGRAVFSGKKRGMLRGEGENLTVQKLVDEYKVVLDRLFVELAKVRPADLDDAVAEFKDERCRCVGLGYCCQGRGQRLDICRARV
jgi:hypothetical protein